MKVRVMNNFDIRIKKESCRSVIKMVSTKSLKHLLFFVTCQDRYKHSTELKSATDNSVLVRFRHKLLVIYHCAQIHSAQQRPPELNRRINIF